MFAGKRRRGNMPQHRINMWWRRNIAVYLSAHRRQQYHAYSRGGIRRGEK